MEILEKEFIKNNYKTIKNISKEVSLIEINNKRYILKQMNVPLSKREIDSQHRFIDYLISNNINTPKIISCINKDDKTYEIQEYIENSDDYLDIKCLLKTISIFHNVSYNYNNELIKNKTYNYEFECKNFKLNRLLLGFRQKYYIFPRKNIMENKFLIDNDKIHYLSKIIKIYDYCYKYFIRNYNINDCIIHNDITSNNIINKNGRLYIIDFDLAIRSSVYVDFVDCILKRYDNIYNVTGKKEFIENIKNYINIYNNYSKVFKLEMDAILCVIILKIISFNGYVLLNKDNKLSFNNGIERLYFSINQLYNLLIQKVELINN